MILEEITEVFNVAFDSVVEVNDGGYELGFEEGIEHAKSTLTEKEITSNGEYVAQGDSLGFNKVIVNVPDINGSYANGFTDGQEQGYQNALEKLTELEVNGNGEYLPSGESIGFKKVIATGYLDTSDATATPEKILDGFTAYVNNEKIEGTIPKYQGESENAEIKTSKLAGLVDGTITEVTEKDLAGVTKLRQYAFAYATTLTSVVLPNTITSIGWYAFNGCKSLTNVVLSNSITSISPHAFNGCDNLPNITIPSTVTSIGDYSFNGCKAFISIEIPNTITSIGHNAFSYCTNLTNIKIGNGVAFMGDNVFNSCSALVSVTFEENSQLTSINYNAFWGCSELTEITIPDSVTKIGNYGFYGCSKLVSLIIPNNVTTISGHAFSNCSKLINLTIGSGVTKIDGSALFIGSTSNKATITFLGTTPPSIQASTFNKSFINKIIVPKGYGETYKSATNWSAFADYIFESE